MKCGRSPLSRIVICGCAGLVTSLFPGILIVAFLNWLSGLPNDALWIVTVAGLMQGVTIGLLSSSSFLLRISFASIGGLCCNVFAWVGCAIASGISASSGHIAGQIGFFVGPYVYVFLIGSAYTFHCVSRNRAQFTIPHLLFAITCIGIASAQLSITIRKPARMILTLADEEPHVEALRNSGATVLVRGIDGWMVIFRSSAFTDSSLRASNQSLASLTNVYLDLNYTAISDTGIKQICQLQNVMGLSLEGTGISDAALVNICQLKRVEYLNIRCTRVSDTGVLHLRRCESLRRLHLGCCDDDKCRISISHKAIYALRDISSLESLQVPVGLSSDSINHLRRELPTTHVYQ